MRINSNHENVYRNNLYYYHIYLYVFRVVEIYNIDAV